MVDKRRRLVLIRRDDQEHLVMIGGPQDLVIETGITPQQAMVQDAPQAQPEAPLERARPPEEQPAARRPERRPSSTPPPPPRARTLDRDPLPEHAPRPISTTPPPISVTPPEREPQAFSDRQTTDQPVSAQERRSLMNVRPGETR